MTLNEASGVRFFAPLRMTMKNAQNDRRRLGMTIELEGIHPQK
jgi:hypothetical protein